jgi:cobalt/nickel transport system permease protein
VRGLSQRLDPRVRILAIVAATIIVASTPPGVLIPFAAYAALCVTLIAMSRVSFSYLSWRFAAASPFILLAALLLSLQAGAGAGASVALKGYTAVLLLSILMATTPLAELLWAMRRMGAPDSLNLILAMMYRYMSMLSEEHARLDRARACRTVKPLGRRLYPIYGRQLGELLLRSWDRAERVHAAMVSRGFHGAWPVARRGSLAVGDAAFLVTSGLLFLAGRLITQQ